MFDPSKKHGYRVRVWDLSRLSEGRVPPIIVDRNPEHGGRPTPIPNGHAHCRARRPNGRTCGVWIDTERLYCRRHEDADIRLILGVDGGPVSDYPWYQNPSEWGE